jgi:hypothetical protein
VYKIVSFGFGRRSLEIQESYETLDEGLSAAITAWGCYERAEGGSVHPVLWLAHTGDRATLTLVGPADDDERARAIEIWDPKSHQCPHCFEPIGMPRHRFFYHRGSEGQCPHCGTAAKRFSEVMLQPGQAVFESVDRGRAEEDQPSFTELVSLVSRAWMAGDESDDYPAGPIFSFVSRAFTRGKRMPRLRESFSLGAAWLDQTRPGWFSELEGADDIAAQLGIEGTVKYGLAAVQMDGFRDVTPGQSWKGFAATAWGEEVASRRHRVLADVRTGSGR